MIVHEFSEKSSARLSRIDPFGTLIDMGHYTNNGKRKSSMVHAGRSWTCPCGRVCWGNGGKSSHQRSCRAAKESALETERSLIVTLRGMANTSVTREAIARHEANAERLEADLLPQQSIQQKGNQHARS